MKKAVFTAGLASFLVLSLVGVGWVAGRVSSGSFIDAEPAREELMFGVARVTVERRVVQVPVEYGSLVSVTPRGESAVLWFSQGDVVRNVVVDPGPVLIQRAGTLTRL